MRVWRAQSVFVWLWTPSMMISVGDPWRVWSLSGTLCWRFIPSKHQSAKSTSSSTFSTLYNVYHKGLMFVWYQHLNIPPSWYWVLFKPVRDFSVYSQKTLNQWQFSWHGEVILCLWDGVLHTLEGPAVVLSWHERRSLQISDKSICTVRPLEQGHYQNLVLSSTDWGEHLVLGRFVLQVLIPMLIPGSILYTRPTPVHTFLLVKKNTDPMWRVSGF